MHPVTDLETASADARMAPAARRRSRPGLTYPASSVDDGAGAIDDIALEILP